MQKGADYGFPRTLRQAGTPGGDAWGRKGVPPLPAFRHLEMLVRTQQRQLHGNIFNHGLIIKK